MKKNKSRFYLPITRFGNLFLLLLIFSSPIYGNMIIRSDTTWHKGEVINTGGSVQIEHGITLSVEGGVSISDNTRFLVLGNLLMIGSENEPVEVNNNSFCFHADYNTPGYIEFNKVIMNGGVFSEAGSCSGYGYFSLMNSEFYEVSGFYLWYPVAASKIAKNIFIASDGLDIVLSGNLDVLNNVFIGQTWSAVSVFANYGNGLNVRYNSFLSLNKTALEVAEGYSSASMIADSNYYGTIDTSNIEERILDRNDSLTRASYIEYVPILDSPHSDTPIINSRSYSLSVSKDGTGSGIVTSNPLGINCGSDCSYDFDLGQTVTLTAIPDSGSYFSGWYGEDGCYYDSCTVTMTGDKTINVAFFSIPLPTYMLTVHKSGLGTITSNPEGIDCGGDCSEAFSANSSVTMTAIPDTGYQFSTWSGCTYSVGPACTVTMTESKSVTAVFTPLPMYELTVKKSGPGKITSTPAGIKCGRDCKESYQANTMVTLTAKPRLGYQLSSWNGCTTINGNICVVEMTAAKLVNAIFTTKN